MKSWVRKWITLGVVGVMSINVMAATNKISIIYNGNAMELAQEPKMVNNSTLLPLRALTEYFGCVVDWNQDTKKIEVRNDDSVIVLYIGEKTALINGKETTLQVVPQVINGSTYVPLRFIGEAMDMGVNWNSQLRQVELKSKYTLDKASGQLMINTKAGKQVVGPVFISKDEMAGEPYLNVKKTSFGSEIVTIYQSEQGALTSSACTTYYIKDGKVIDKIIPEDTEVILGYDVFIDKELVIFSSNGSIRIYDDTQGQCIKTLNVSSFSISHATKNYLVGHIGNDTTVIDLVTGKTTKILDAIPNEKDKQSVCMEDIPFCMDMIEVVWVQEDAVVFKYYSETEGKEKTITYKVGVGII